jgi:putative tryptophan/tyrosine transport system substrate-binding protein
MRRREFLGLLGSAAIAWPVAAQQPSAKMPWIGYLTERVSPGEFDEAFLRGLHELGYVEGRTIAIEYRWAEGKAERLPALAAELVALKVDVIVTGGTPAIKAAKEATTTIPIVMASSPNAVGDGLVASLAHPGGNVTGQSVYAPELTRKRFELRKEAVPGLSRVAALWNARNLANRGQLQEAETAGRALGIAIESLGVHLPEDLEEGAARVAQAGAGAILTLSDSATISYRSQIAAAALLNRLPTMFSNKAYLGGGGLMSYGPDITEIYRHAAAHVDKILKGARPADLPVEQPTKFELVVNLKTAKAIGLTIPESFLLRADEVIE